MRLKPTTCTVADLNNKHLVDLMAERGLVVISWTLGGSNLLANLVLYLEARCTAADRTNPPMMES